MKSKKSSPAGEFAEVAGVRIQMGMTQNDPGWAIQDYMKQFGLGRSAAEREINRMVEAGELLAGRARRRDPAGKQLRWVNVYRTK